MRLILTDSSLFNYNIIETYYGLENCQLTKQKWAKLHRFSLPKVAFTINLEIVMNKIITIRKFGDNIAFRILSFNAGKKSMRDKQTDKAKREKNTSLQASLLGAWQSMEHRINNPQKEITFVQI